MQKKEFHERKYLYNGNYYSAVESVDSISKFKLWDRMLEFKLKYTLKELRYAEFEIKDNILLLQKAKFERPYVCSDESIMKELGFKYDVDPCIGGIAFKVSKFAEKGAVLFKELNLRVDYTGKLLLEDNVNSDSESAYKGKISKELMEGYREIKVIELTVENGRIVDEQRYPALLEELPKRSLPGFA